MKLLLDASALLNTIRLRKQSAFRLLKDNLTLSLTKYEIGNILWKEALLLKRISVEEALETISLLDKILKIMRIVDPLNSDVILKLACSLQTTYYDASYVVASRENDAKLVTDDVKLVRKIQENIEVATKILGTTPEVLTSEKTLRSP